MGLAISVGNPYLGDDEGDPFGIEQAVWLTLHEACRVSIAHGNAVVFH